MITFTSLSRGSLLYMLLMAFACNLAHAAVPFPPTLCPEQGPCASAEGGTYDLYSSDRRSRGQIPFQVAWPELPRITSERTVIPSTFAANNVNGRRLILTPGNYPSVQVSGVDKEWILQDGAVLGHLTYTGQRFRISGGTVSGIRTHSGASDITIDNVYLTGSNDVWWDIQRLALINSRVHTDGFGLFVLWNTRYPRPSDIIIAGNDIDMLEGGGYSPIRFESFHRVVIVDNRLRSNGHFATLRFHPETSLSHVWVRNNQMEGGGWQWGTNSGATSQMEDVWMYDNAVYGDNAAFGVAPATSIYRMSADNNLLYSDFYRNGGEWIPGRSGWTLGSNPAQPGGYINPPGWTGIAVN